MGAGGSVPWWCTRPGSKNLRLGVHRGRYHGRRRPSSDDTFHSPAFIPPLALDKPSIMKRYHRRRTTRWGVTARSPTMVTLHDTRWFARPGSERSLLAWSNETTQHQQVRTSIAKAKCYHHRWRYECTGRIRGYSWVQQHYPSPQRGSRAACTA